MILLNAHTLPELLQSVLADGTALDQRGRVLSALLALGGKCPDAKHDPAPQFVYRLAILTIGFHIHRPAYRYPVRAIDHKSSPSSLLHHMVLHHQHACSIHMDAHRHQGYACRQGQPCCASPCRMQASPLRAECALGEDQDATSSMEKTQRAVVCRSPFMQLDRNMSCHVQVPAQNGSSKDGFRDKDMNRRCSSERDQEGVNGRGVIGDKDFRTIRDITFTDNIKIKRSVNEHPEEGPNTPVHHTFPHPCLLHPPQAITHLNTLCKAYGLGRFMPSAVRCVSLGHSTHAGWLRWRYGHEKMHSLAAIVAPLSLCYTEDAVRVVVWEPGLHIQSRIQDRMNPFSLFESSVRAPRATFTRMYSGMLGLVTFTFGMFIEGEGYLTGEEARGLFFLLLLAGLASLEFLHIGYEGPILTRLGLLGIRIALIEGLVSLDNSGIALFLHPIVVFIAYFAIGENFSALTSLLYLAYIIFRVALIDPSWYLSNSSALLVVAFASILVFMQILAAAMNKEERHRKQTEALLADLQTSHFKLQAYADHVAEMAASEERNRLARDIHDSLGHYLTAVKIQLEKAVTFQDRNPTTAQEALASAREAATKALEDVRLSVSTLREPQPFSLSEALRELVLRSHSEELELDLKMSGEEAGYANSVLVTLYRAAQEGLTNIQKHANARHATLTVTFGETSARLSLTDDGAGMLHEPEKDESNVIQRFGLQGIRERMRLVKGEMSIESGHDFGTRMTLVVPRDPRDTDQIEYEEKLMENEG